MITAFSIAILTLSAHNAQSLNFGGAVDFIEHSFNPDTLVGGESNAVEAVDTDGNSCRYVQTTEWGFTAGYGYYFDVYSYAPIEINAIGVHMKPEATASTVKVYKRKTPGTYVGAEMRSNQWDLLHTSQVSGKGYTDITDLYLDEPIVLESGVKHGFRIVSDSRTLFGLSYDKRRGYTGAKDQVFNLLAGDVTYSEGTWADIPVDQEPVLFNAKLSYCQMGPADVIPDLTRQVTGQNCPSMTLDSHLWGNVNVPVHGNYFNVMARHDIKIVGFRVHANTGEHTIRIYKSDGPHEDAGTDEGNWELIHTEEGVVVTDPEERTTLIKLPDLIKIGTNETIGFLIVSDKDLLSREIKPAGLGFSHNQYLQIYNGPEAIGEFEGAGGSYGFNGITEYCIDVDNEVVIT